MPKIPQEFFEVQIIPLTFFSQPKPKITSKWHYFYLKNISHKQQQKITSFYLESVKDILSHKCHTHAIRTLASFRAPLCLHLCSLINCCQSSANFLCVLFFVLLKNQIIKLFVIEKWFQTGRKLKSMNFYMTTRVVKKRKKKNSSKVCVTLTRTACGMSKRNEKTYKSSRWHCDTCLFRRIGWMNHSGIDCFTMKTLVKTEPATHTHKSRVVLWFVINKNKLLKQTATNINNNN